MTRPVLRVALLALLLTPRAATARDPRQNMPGQFDFYVLSLSWSPSFCLAPPNGAPVPRRAMCNAVPDPIRSSSMACDRNMTMAFRNIARSPRHGSIAACFHRCWI